MSMSERVLLWDKYYITEKGNVYRKLAYTYKKIKPRIKTGYATVNLVKNNKVCEFTIHRLVAGTFIPNPDNLPHVNHINGKRADNRIENLEWCTPKSNIANAISRRTHYPTNRRQLTESRVREIKQLLAKGHRPTEIADRFNLSSHLVYNIRSRNTYKDIDA